MMVRSPDSSQALFRRSSESISSTWKMPAALRRNSSGKPSGGKAVHQAVGGQDLQARRVHVDEGHHHAVGAGQVRVLVAECQRGLVAVMAVGDQQLLVRHQLLDRARRSAIFQRRCTAPYSSVTSASGGPAAACVQQGVDGARPDRGTA